MISTLRSKAGALFAALLLSVAVLGVQAVQLEAGSGAGGGVSVSIGAEAAQAHDCELGHWAQDTPERAAVDLNGDGDMTDPGEAAVTAADGECVGQTQILNTISTEAFSWLAVGIAIFAALAGFGFVCMLIALGVKKGLSKISSLVGKG